jgi:hypothetical protein
MNLLRRALLDPHSRTYIWVSDVLAVATVVSVLVVVLETVPVFGIYERWFVLTEWLMVGLFTLEYIARVAVTKPRRSYIFSFFGIVDLVAILPTLLGLGNLSFLKSARALRIIRLLRLLRLTKLSRSGVNAEDVSILSFNVLIYVPLLTVSLLVTGSLLIFGRTSNKFIREYSGWYVVVIESIHGWNSSRAAGQPSWGGAVCADSIYGVTTTWSFNWSRWNSLS